MFIFNLFIWTAQSVFGLSFSMHACLYMYIYIFRSRHSLSSFSFGIRHASTFPYSQCLQPPRRTASRVSLHQRDAFGIIGWYTLARAYRFVSLSAAIRSRTPTASSFSRPLYARARLPLWLRPLYTRARLPFLSLAPSDIRAGSRRATMLIRHSRACSLSSRSCLCWHAGKHPSPDMCRFREVRPLPLIGVHIWKLLYEHAQPAQTIYRDLRFHEL